MKYIIETKRLRLRQITSDDFNNLKGILSDKETMKYFSKTYDDNGVLKWIDWCKACYKKRGFGLWAVELKDTNEFIGDTGITLQNIDGEEVFEIGYHYNMKYWNNGYASEVAKVCKKWFFENTNYNEVYSYMNVNNISSRKVAEHNGMTFIKDYYRNDEHLAVYRITRQDYINQNSINKVNAQ